MKRAAYLLLIFAFIAIGLIPHSYGEEKEVEIVLSFAGDCTLGRNETSAMENSFTDVFNRQGGRYGYFFENVANIFFNDDLTVVNLEGPLTTGTARADKEFAFKGSPEYVNILKEGGIDAVNLVNNHINDYGERGIKDTLTALGGAGIGYFGAGSGYIAEIKGIKIGLLGYKGWVSGSEIKKIIAGDINSLKKKGANIVITNFHWGDERANYPNLIQKDLGRYAIDAGADLVIGHHPHVLQGIEKYKGKYIVYSLANFCFGGNRNPADKDTFIFQHSLTFAYKDSGYVLKRADAIIYPCLVSSVKGINDYKPTLASGNDWERIRKRLIEYSAPFGNLNEMVSFAKPPER